MADKTLKFKIELDTDQAIKKADKLDKAVNNISKSSKKQKQTHKEATDVGSEGFEKLGQKVEKFGLKLVGATGGLILILKAFQDVGSAQKIIAQMTGATGDELTRLVRLAEHLAATTAISSETAGKLVSTLAKTFGLAGDELAKTSEIWAKFIASVPNGEDLLPKLTDMFSKWGLSVEQSDLILNRLLQTSQDFGIPMEDLIETLAEQRNLFDELGLSYESAIALMAKLKAGGYDAGSMITNLTTAVRSLAKDGEDVGVVLRDLFQKMKDGTLSAEETEKLNQLLGKSFIDLQKAIQDGTLSFDDLDDILGQIEDRVDSTADASKSFQDVFMEAFHAILEPLTPVLLQLTKMVNLIMNTLQPVLDALFGDFEGAIPGMYLFAKALDFVGRVAETIVYIVHSLMYALEGLFYALTFQWDKAGEAFAKSGASMAKIGEVWSRDWNTDKNKNPDGKIDDNTQHQTGLKPKKGSSLNTASDQSLDAGKYEGQVVHSDFIWDDATMNDQTFSATSDITLMIDGKKLTNIVAQNIDGEIRFLQPSLKSN